MDRKNEPDLRVMTAPDTTLAINAASIEVRDVVKAYGATRAADRVSFKVGKGEIMSLLGPSGCGKTTVMRMIAGLVSPDSGDVCLENRSITDVPVNRRNIGMLFQNYALFPHLNVAGNIAFGLEMRRLPAREIAQRVNDVLDLIKLRPMAERMPHQLSGGQQQRVALARALVIEPSVLLLDEPFGALDKKLRETMQFETRQLQQRLGITTLMVTHDQEEALTMSDKIVVMRDGRVEQFGTPSEVYERPASRFVADFIGTANFFVGRSDSGAARMIRCNDGTSLLLNEELHGSDPITVAVRPERIRIAPPKATAEPNSTSAIVEQIVYQGLNTRAFLRRPQGETIVVVVPQSDMVSLAHLGSGSAVQLSWNSVDNIPVRDDAA
jgi:spermidine/putrescine ABC transporter ATP-binding subunit